MDILQKLRGELPVLPKKLALAARYALDNPDRIALDSMRGSAGRVGVTSTTMLRLARQLGYESYEDFKAGFQNQLVTKGFGERAGALHNGELIGETASLSETIYLAAQRNLRRTISESNLTDLSAVAHSIREAKACYLLGSGSIFWLASFFKNTGSMILPNLRLIGPEFPVAAEALGQLSVGDVLLGIGISPCATRTIEGMRFAKDAGVKTIALTDRPSSPLAEQADFVLCADTQGPHYYPSIIAVVSLVETILATVVAEGGEQELERIGELEGFRKINNAYVEY
ncbi:MAG: MurR/RpiR family transcriptional regulator [Pseudomonadota bacterium]